MFNLSKTGLTSARAKELLSQYGLNEIEKEKRFHWLKLLWSQFTSPLIYVLFFAGVITFYLKEWDDALVIFMAVGINVVLGFFQEYKAEKALTALAQIINPKTKVIRDNQEASIEVSQLVPGDVVILQTGNKIPADGILLESIDLAVNEAMLTGESIPIDKKVKNEIYMGTIIVAGRGMMLVTKTGKLTRMGNIAHQLMETEEEETPLKIQFNQLSKQLVIVFGAMCFLIFITGLIKGINIVEIFTLSVALAVAAIPESLSVSLTVILTIGMQKILQTKGLVRKLMTAETLATIDTICVDKTGTLTEGKMKVEECVPKDSHNMAKLVEGAILCNNMTTTVEMAMMEWVKVEVRSKKLAVGSIEELIKLNPRLDEIPFSSQKKYIAVLTKKDLIISGAPEVVLSFCQLSLKEKDQWLTKIKTYGKQGLRVVSFAWRSRGVNEHKIREELISNNLIGYGLLIFTDPVRLDVKESLAKAEQAGIHIKVITGDFLETAEAVIRKLGIESHHLQSAKAISGAELAIISDQELGEKIEKATLFYRTTPEQKIRIVNALQKRGHSVAMMGDGINDALALKKADVGIVVGEASEVAKETADMVLLDSKFATIVAAVEEGRGIFINIKKMVLYLLSHSFTEIILIAGSFLLGLATPLLAVQILWINLVEHGLGGLAMAFEPKEKNLLRQLPFKKNHLIIDKDLQIMIFGTGIMTDLFLFAGYYYLLQLKFGINIVRTVMFVSIVINAILRAFVARAYKKNIWRTNLLSNKYLLVSTFLGFLILIFSLYLSPLSTLLKTQPLNLNLWGLSIGLALIGIVGSELTKIIFFKEKTGR